MIWHSLAMVPTEGNEEYSGVACVATQTCLVDGIYGIYLSYNSSSSSNIISLCIL